ncbi:MAG: RrF2 family transcriptional regulator [Hyphomicrobium sp.]
MRLTKQTGHAIRILLDCAQSDGGLLKVADISNRLGITKQNVFKIVHILSRAGFVAAVRGPSGGVRLARPSSEIKVGDVVRAIEVTRVRVESAKSANRGEQNSLNAVFDDALGAFIAVLDQHTLAELSDTSAGVAAAVPGRKRSPTGKRAAESVGGGLRRTTSRRA